MAARTDDKDVSQENSQQPPFERLLQAVEGYAVARGQQLAERAGRQITNAADRVTEAAESGDLGLLPSIGIRKAAGHSTLGATASAGLGKVKDTVQHAAKSVTGKAKGKQGKSKSKGGGKFVHITESIDIGVPIDVAYNHWTRFEEFSTWAKGVSSVDRDDDISSQWKVKVGPSSRSWKANVQTQVPDERIAWTSEGPKGTTRGVVTFHELGERLTRVVVVLEYHPSGPIEKIGNLWRAQGRRVRLDLKHFRHFVMFAEDEDADGWRGEIRDGDVVREPEDEEEASGAGEDDEEGEEGEDEEYEDDEADDVAAEDEDEDEDEEDEDEEEEEEDEDDEERPEDEDEEDEEDEEEYEDDEPEDEYEDDEYEEDEGDDEYEEDESEDEDAGKGRRVRASR